MPSIDPTFQSEAFALWNALADYPVARTGDALAHFFRESVRLLDADGARWCLTVRLGTDALAQNDLCQGWRVREVLPANPTPELLARIRDYLDGMHKQDPERVGETTVSVLRTGGRFRVQTLYKDLVDYERFRQTVHYRLYYEPYGITDRMWVGCPVNADVDSGFVFDRLKRTDNDRFTTDEQARAAFLLGGIKWFHRRLVLGRKITAGRTPCTPAERKALGLLLTGKSEKEIADALGLGLGTVHSRVTTIYRKFGVRGRAELMALWL